MYIGISSEKFKVDFYFSIPNSYLVDFLSRWVDSDQIQQAMGEKPASK